MVYIGIDKVQIMVKNRITPCISSPLSIKTIKLFQKENFFVFTSDIDWAPEWAIAKTLEIFKSTGVPLTPFITHESEVIKREYANEEKSHYVGLHPNFFPNSDHGNNYIEVINFVTNLWPESICFRSHGMFDNGYITDEFYARGFKYDSNLCLFLQPHCFPLNHVSGLLRFPIFWVDDAHFNRGLKFKIDTIKSHLELPGLKVFNFHPLPLAINTPNREYYLKHKFLYKTQKHWHNYVFEGEGEQTFLEELISYLKKRETSFYYLDDLFEKIRELNKV